jgi:DHA1 family bicyclomycin/chloramphenicol resistance-like MFS transporter
MSDTSSSLRDKLPLPLMAAVAALPPLAVDMYLPAIPQIADDLQTSISAIQNSLSIFLVGFGLGMLCFGPMSDRYGRRPLALFGLTGFALSSLLLALSTTSSMFLFFRLTQGFLGSAASVVIPAMIRDCYGKDTAKGMSAVTMIMLVAPLLAPLMGSLLLTLAPWQGLFVALTCYPLVVLLIAWWRLPETKAMEVHSERKSLLANYRIILGNKRIYLDLLSFMLSALAFFAYLTSVSFVYITYYGVSETLFGVLFACSASALILANFINVRVVSRYGSRRMMHAGLALGTGFALLLLVVTIFDMSLYWTVACFVCIVGCFGISAVNADSLVIVEFPRQASSASAVTGTLRFGCGALAGPILAWTYDGTPLPIAILLLCAFAGASAAQVLRKVIHKSG